MDPQIPWEDTYEGKAERVAHSNYLNYFLPVAYNEIALRKRIHTNLDREQLQVLIAIPSDDYWHKYLDSCFRAFFDAGENNTIESLSIYLRASIKNMVAYAETLPDKVDIAYAIKKSDRYTLDELVYIAKFVGAIGSNDASGDYIDNLALDNIEYLSECNISMSSNLLKNKIANARAIISSLSPNS